MKKLSAVRAGLYSLPAILMFHLFSCQQSPPPPVVQQPALDTDYRVSFKLDGTPLSWTQSQGYTTGHAGDYQTSAPGDGSSNFAFSSWVSYNGQSFEFKKGTIFYPNGGQCEDTDFANFFSPGSSPYSVDAQSGVVFEFNDGVELWSTDLGTADQSGSAFEILSSQHLTIYDDYTLKLELKFNCKLYNNSGAVKTLTDGEFLVDVRKL